MTAPLILPKHFHFDFSDPRTKPRGPVEYDGDHFLFKQLVQVVTTDNHVVMESLYPLNRPTTINGTVGMIPQADYAETVGDGSYFWQFPRGDNLLEFSFDVNTDYSHIILANFKAGGWANYGAIMSWDNTSASGARCEFNVVNDYVYLLHGDSYNFATQANIRPVYDEPVLLAATLKRATNTVQLWQCSASRGVEYGEHTYTSNAIQYHRCILIGSSGSQPTVRTAEGKLHYGMLLRGRLTDAQVRSLWQEPWKWLQPQISQAVYQPEGGIVPTPVDPHDINQSQIIDPVTLTQSHQLVINELAQAQDLDEVALTQAHIIGVNGLAQSQNVDQVSLTVEGAITVTSLAQSQSVDQVALTVAHALTVDAISQNQSIDPATITPTFAVAVADLIQGQVIDAVTLQLPGLQIDSLFQGQIIDQTTLTQHHVVTVEGLTHSQLLDVVRLGGIVIGALDGDVVAFVLQNGKLTVVTRN